MRSSVTAFTLVLGLALGGCLGGGSSVTGPTTLGDQGHTVWQMVDGLCGDGLFGTDCDLNQRVAMGATPLLQIRGHGGTSLDRATLMGGPGVTLSGQSTTNDDHGTLMQAIVGIDAAGVGDIIVLDGSGHEIDRAHLTFVTAATITCGELRTSVTRDLTFPGLTSGTPVTLTMAATDTQATTTLACRANDASGNALLTVHAIQWSVASGATGMLQVRSDDLLGSTPAVGATARVVTMGTASGTIHAMLGSATADVAVTAH